MFKKLRKSKINKRIIKSLKKIGAAVLAVMLFSAVVKMGSTNAGFLDEEISEGNEISAGTLDFTLASKSDFSPKITPVQTVSRSAILTNAGVLDFQYKTAAKNLSGDLCDYLEIKDDLTDAYLPLAGYASALTNNTVKTNWIFTVRLIDDDHSLENKTCDFDLEFTGWQTDFADDTDGWSDREIITSQIQSGEWINPGEVVINEIMWMGSNEDSGDEWIELRNMTGQEIDISNWNIVHGGSGTSGHIEIPDGYSIEANGFFLLTRKKWNETEINFDDDLDKDEGYTHISGMNLLNDGESLILENENNQAIDTAWKYANWPAGVNTTLKQSMERNDIPGDGTQSGSWHTCVSDLCNDGTYWDTADGNNYGTPGAPNLSPVVMNEIVFNPSGENKEWVELYNLLEKDYDVADWYFTNGDGDKVVVSEDNVAGGKTKVPGKGYLTVYLGKNFLDDESDTLSFYNDMGTPDGEDDDVKEDGYKYENGGDFPEDKSSARFPDGTGIWIDPEATPGKENKLDKKEEAGLQLLVYEKCFDGKRLKKNNETEICAPVFLQYLKMIKELDGKKIRKGTLLDILEMKEEMENKKLNKILEETENLLEEQDVPAPANSEAPAAAPDSAGRKSEISPPKDENNDLEADLEAQPPSLEAKPLSEFNL